ncbi:MAG: hypothetical protein QXH30_00015 [Candidatus Bilamarchaeaceae archaeon]
MDVPEIEKILLEREKELDAYIRDERGVVRLCAKAIKEVHKGNLAEAKELAARAKSGMEALPKIGNRKRAVEQEYAEAAALIAVAEEGGIPSSGEMGVEPEAYLLGLLDCIGEMKRLVVERLRRGEREAAERYFQRMEEIYDAVGHLHFSGALVPDLRHKQDVCRALLEDARGKLIK